MLAIGLILVNVVFATTRIENEYKLAIPLDKTEEVWAHLHQNNERFKQNDIEISYSDEYFQDIYFDDANFSLLKNESGLRRRIRIIPLQPNNPKNGRSLIQFKLNRNKVRTIRTEIKFEVKDKYIGSHTHGRPMTLLKNKEKAPYQAVLGKLHLTENDLLVSLIVVQRRRRVYIKLHGEPFATISLDDVTASKWWVTKQFVEVELELNEKLYTISDENTRQRMQVLLDTIKKNLEQKLPYVKQDQTPKYNKMFNELSAAIPFYKRIVQFESWFR